MNHAQDDNIQELYRNIHSLKGTGGTLDLPIITSICHQFESFFHKEIELRKQLGYPPFSYLACLRIRGNNQKDTARMAQRIGNEIRGTVSSWPKKGGEIQILGPAEAPFAKLKGKYRWQMLIKSQRTELLHYL